MKYRKTPMHPKYPVMKASSYGKILWNFLDDDGETVFLVKWFGDDGSVEHVEKCRPCWIEPIGYDPAEKEGEVRCASIW